VSLLASDPARDEQLRRLRDAYPVFRIQAADAHADGGTVRVTFTFAVGGRMFRPSVEFSGLRSDEAARVTNPAAQRIVRALAIVEAASYWKATVSPVIEIGIGAADPAEVAWWGKFWIPAMGEFLYSNGVDFTAPGFLQIATAPGLPGGEPPASGGQVSAERPLARSATNGYRAARHLRRLVYRHPSDLGRLVYLRLGFTAGVAPPRRGAHRHRSPVRGS
jgi:hypothetical protein